MAVKIGAADLGLRMSLAVDAGRLLSGAVILWGSEWGAVTPRAVKYGAFNYKPSLTGRVLHADHSGTPEIVGQCSSKK